MEQVTERGDERIIEVKYNNRTDKIKRSVLSSGIQWYPWVPEQGENGDWLPIDTIGNERLEAIYQAGMNRGKRH